MSDPVKIWELGCDNPHAYPEMQSWSMHEATYPADAYGEVNYVLYADHIAELDKLRKVVDAARSLTGRQQRWEYGQLQAALADLDKGE